MATQSTLSNVGWGARHKPAYNRSSLAQALRAVGIKRGDVVFSHSNIGFFGVPEEGRTPDVAFKTIFGAFQDVLGDGGTLVVPTFTYSFCKREPYDPQQTPSTCGAFTEMLRQHPDACRSRDPIFSVAAIGGQARSLTADVSQECFGKNSFWDRFLEADGVVCNMNFDAGSTLVHYIERQLNVPYRFDKVFPGTIIEQGRARKTSAIFFCQDLSNADTVAAFESLDEFARSQGVLRTALVGRGSLVSVSARDLLAVIKRGLEDNPWLLTVSAKADRPPRLLQPNDRFDVQLPENATMWQMVESLWRLPRDIVSDGYDAALAALSHQLPMTIHEYPTGTPAWTWIVPEKWTCHEAYLETLDGRRLFAYDDCPLHVVSYSLPFDGEVSREELFEHLHVHPRLDDAVPFVFKYYERDWGLCCSRRQKEKLADPRYRVVIRSSFSYGTLKVGEVIAPGRSQQTIILCAHLCHPAMYNDDLSGVVVGMNVMRALLDREDLRFTYRFLIVPETIGSLTYLSHHEPLIESMRGGLFLEALGLEHPHALQRSFQGDSEMDRCCRLALRDLDPSAWVGDYRRVIGNDERQFNAPGVRVPMVSLSRVLPPESPQWPYRTYHSDLDRPDADSAGQLEHSVQVVLGMVDAVERNLIPVNRYKGEIFCSRYGLHVDMMTDPQRHVAFFDIVGLVDGTRTVVEIAEACGADLKSVRAVLDGLERHDLVRYVDPLLDG